MPATTRSDHMRGPTTRRARRWGAWLAVPLVLAGVSACADEDEDTARELSSTTSTTSGSGPDGAGEPATTDDLEVPDGWVALEGDGVALAGPEGWEVVDLTDDDFSDLLDSAAELNEAMGEALTDQVRSLASSGALLFAASPTPDGQFDNVNVIRFPGSAPTPELLRLGAASQIEQVGGTVVDSDVVELPAGRSVRLEYTLALPGTPTGTVTGVQYYVVGEDETLVVTITLGSASDAGLADDMARTLVIG